MESPGSDVTFLFTDIEGSTTLWDHYPARMREALARHDALLRSAIESNGGRVFKTMGDAFCAGFATPSEAVQASIAAQRALEQVKWPAECQIRVRMAIHTGPAFLRDRDYYGPTLNRVARLLSAAHGGQVLVSDACAELLHQSLPSGVHLLDLARHHLKDLQEPERIWQIVADGLRIEFPPLRSLHELPNNLPATLTSFVGREREIAQVKSLLASTRLLTLTGPGGTGKTRLAVQVAEDLLEEYQDGVWLVELASLTHGAFLSQAVAAALCLREEPGRPLAETLSEYLAGKTILLLLDNCEHLLEECAPLVQSLLRGSRTVSVLATSREPLGIAGEQTWRVPSLSVPAPSRGGMDASALLQYEAVHLFLERATLVQPAFALTDENVAAVCELCRQLDGIPLAIELAAARVKATSVEQITARLNDRFRLLTGGSRTALPRQQTLRGLIDWSYDLLSEEERAALCRCSVFSGGWTLEAAEAVCASTEGEKGRRGEEESPESGPSTFNRGAQPRHRSEGLGQPSTQSSHLSPLTSHLTSYDLLDLLTQLVDKSLITYEERGGAGRYSMLETVRAYAREKLEESGTAAETRARHRAYFLRMATEADQWLTGPDQARWLDQVDREHDNVRAALDGNMANDPDAALRMAAALGRFWSIRGYLTEGRKWLKQALATSTEDDPVLRGRALDALANLTRDAADFAEARTLYEEALRMHRQSADLRGEATTLTGLGNMARYLADYESSSRYHLQALALRRALGDARGIAVSLTNLSIVALMQKEYTQAREMVEESLALFRKDGNRHGTATALTNLASIASAMGAEPSEAIALEMESLEIKREIGDKVGISVSLYNLGSARMAQGDPEEAARLLGAFSALREEIGAPVTPAEREEYERTVAVARETLGDERFARAWETGRALGAHCDFRVAVSAVPAGTAPVSQST